MSSYTSYTLEMQQIYTQQKVPKTPCFFHYLFPTALIFYPSDPTIPCPEGGGESVPAFFFPNLPAFGKTLPGWGQWKWRYRGAKLVEKKHQNEEFQMGHMDVSENSWGKSPPNHPHFNRVFHYFHHPFWGIYPYFWISTHMFEKVASPLRPLGGGNSKIFVIFIPKIGELIQFDDHIFQMGWFNHQVARCCWKDVFFYIFNVMVQGSFRCEGKMMKDVFCFDEIHFFPRKELQSPLGFPNGINQGQLLGCPGKFVNG